MKLAERLFRRRLELAGIPAPVAEYRFHPVRKWRMDYAWPDAKLALEVDGGVFVRGKHSRGAGILKDQEKRNTAVAMGWRVLVVVPSKLPKLETAQFIADALQAAA